MFEISEPLPQSKPGLLTIHDIASDGKRIGHVEVGYIQDNEVKTFRKYTKRKKLAAGQPYGTQLFLDAKEAGVTAESLGKKNLAEIVAALKAKFTGLEDRDIFIMELTAEGKKIVCRASALQS